MAGQQENEEGLNQSPEDAAAEEAAFASGFNTVSGIVSEVEDNPNLEVVELQPDDAGAAPQPGTEEVVEQAPAQEAAPAADDDDAPVPVSKRDFNRLMQLAEMVPTLQEELKTTKDKTFGKLGSLQQVIDTVKAQATAGKSFTAPQLKRLSEEYPDLAEILTADLGDAFAAPAPAAPDAAANPVDEQASGDKPGADAAHDPLADPRVQERMQQLEQETRQAHMAVVDARHPDWRTLPATPEFAEWRNGLPADLQQILENTWDATVLTEAFDGFKSWRDKRNASASAKVERDKRLQDAIPATTGRATGAHVVDEDAAFAAGFKKARGGR